VCERERESKEEATNLFTSYKIQCLVKNAKLSQNVFPFTDAERLTT
jgi:hypothetical protein